jgi:hypothetical protein
MDRPSRIWKTMPSDTRLLAADAFWRDDESPEVELQHVEALMAIARRLNFRQKTVRGMPVERRAAALARIGDVSDALATRALIALHFQHRREMMGAFLDALGVEHDHGMIANEDGIEAPSADALAKAIETLRAGFPDPDVTLYLRTLVAVDEDTWTHLDGLVEQTA